MAIVSATAFEIWPYRARRRAGSGCICPVARPFAGQLSTDASIRQGGVKIGGGASCLAFLAPVVKDPPPACIFTVIDVPASATPPTRPSRSSGTRAPGGKHAGSRADPSQTNDCVVEK